MKTLISLAIWGPRWRGGGGGFNNQTGPILVHIHPLIYINLQVKYGSNLIRTFRVRIKKYENQQKIFFFRGHVEPLHKIHNVSKCRPHRSGYICTTGKTIETQFFILTKMLSRHSIDVMLITLIFD